jgi:hypothetical protein
MPLSRKQLQDYCLYVNQDVSRRCRYLYQDDMDPSKYECWKHCGKKAEIDEEIENFLDDCAKKGQDPTTQGVPLGDNCKGYPVLKSIEQGYDHD